MFARALRANAATALIARLCCLRGSDVTRNDGGLVYGADAIAPSPPFFATLVVMLIYSNGMKSLVVCLDGAMTSATE